MDPALAPFVSKHPVITYRFLRDRLFHSEFKQDIGDRCETVGIFPCGNCGYCQLLDSRKHIILPNGSDFKPKHYVNCITSSVVYLLLCQCRCGYVSKTKLEFWKRIYRHMVSINKKDTNLPLGRHSYLVHRNVTPRVKFLALDHIHSNPRGGDFTKLLLQSELK